MCLLMTQEMVDFFLANQVIIKVLLMYDWAGDVGSSGRVSYMRHRACVYVTTGNHESKLWAIQCGLNEGTWDLTITLRTWSLNKLAISKIINELVVERMVELVELLRILRNLSGCVHTGAVCIRLWRLICGSYYNDSVTIAYITLSVEFCCQAN